MSFSKRDRLFPVKLKAISDEELAKIVASALRKDFGETPSAVKRIGLLTNANLRAIKNWYQARHAPSSGHLLLLARSSVSILQFVLEQIGGEDLWDAFQLLSNGDRAHESTLALPTKGAIYTDKFVSINVTIIPTVAGKLNERQLWFIGMLQQNRKVKAEDIVRVWSVNERTAWRDVKVLSDMEIIQFLGAKKKGQYQLIDD